MEPGLELDELIIREIMQYKIVTEGSLFWSKAEAPYPYAQISGYNKWRGWHLWEDASSEDWVSREFRPSEDIEAAWEVVEKIKNKLQIFTYFNDEQGFEDGWAIKIDGKYVEGFDNASEAICKAALLSVLETEQ